MRGHEGKKLNRIDASGLEKNDRWGKRKEMERNERERRSKKDNHNRYTQYSEFEPPDYIGDANFLISSSSKKKGEHKKSCILFLVLRYENVSNN